MCLYTYSRELRIHVRLAQLRPCNERHNGGSQTYTSRNDGRIGVGFSKVDNGLIDSV